MCFEKIFKGKRSSLFLLVLIVFLGGLLRFWKLDWGNGYLFHPDEYHVAASVTQLSFPKQMNPHFFSYGSFTVYLIYFTQLLLSILHKNQANLFFQAILLGRFYAALFSTLTIPVVFYITRRLIPKSGYAYLSAFLVSILPGSIQQAHFATPESNLTFWMVATLLFLIKARGQKKINTGWLWLASACLGIAAGVKVIAITFLPLFPLLAITLFPIRSLKLFKFFKSWQKLIGWFLKNTFFPPLITLATFFLVFPFSFLDYPSFRNNFNYESGVGIGNPVVFYTRQFIKTVPGIFQLEKIFPYALGPTVEILGILGFLLIIILLARSSLKRKFPPAYYSSLIVLAAFLLYVLPNAFLFAKWTRFMAPSFPFFAIFSTYFVFCLFTSPHLAKITPRHFFYLLLLPLLLIHFFWTVMFFSIYQKPDVRVTATRWINENLPPDSIILVEAGNMLEVPLSGNQQRIGFDFYNFEENPSLKQQFPQLLEKSDYFIVQSRRMFANFQRLPEQFPKTARFYDLLFGGQLGFEKIEEFNAYPQFSILKLRLFVPDEKAEETWSVFDHPVIRIYKKVHYFSESFYEAILQL